MNSLFGLRDIASGLGIESREVLARRGGMTGQRLIQAAGPRRDDWIRIVAKKDADAAQIFIYDEIAWYGTSAQSVVDELRELEVDTINVHINSIGGSVFDGIAIYNALRTHKAKIVTQVDSAALSIASVIAQAGDVRRMVSGAQMMIHEAWGMAMGNATDMREYAELLDRQTKNIANIYAEQSGRDMADFVTMMEGETWLDADEAVAEGLADEVVRPVKSEDDDDDPGQGDKESKARWLRDFAASASTVT